MGTEPQILPARILSKLVWGVGRCPEECPEWMEVSSWDLTLGFGTVWQLYPSTSRFSRWFFCLSPAWAASHSLRRLREDETLSTRNFSSPQPLREISGSWNESENDPCSLYFSPLPNSRSAHGSCTAVRKGEIQGWISGHLAVIVKTKWLTGSLC